MEWIRGYDRFADGDWPRDVEGRVRVALVGLGGFTRERIVPAMAAATHATVTVVVSGSPEKAERVAEACGAGTTLTYEAFTDGEALGEYDAVYVATPNATHAAYARTALEHDRAVLCEKPMTATVEAAEGLAERAAAADATFMVAYRMQAHPLVRWARELLEDGAIGEPLHARGSMSQPIFEVISPDPDQWRLNPDLSGGAAANDLGIYPLNTTRFLVGSDPVRVAATTRSPTDAFDGVDEHAAFQVAFEGGLLGSYTASQNAATTSHLHVTGTRGELRIEPAFFGDVTLAVETDAGSATFDAADVNEIDRTVEYFASHVLRGAAPGPDARHGLVDMRALDALYTAADEDRWVEVTS